jgi:MFS family permease
MKGPARYIIPSFVFFGFAFGFRLFYAFAPLHLQNLGLGQSGIGMIIAVYPMSMLVMSVPFGMMSDRFSPRTAAMAGLLVLSASIWALRGADSFQSLFLCFMGIGTGVTMYTISAASLYFKSLGDTRKGVKLALFNSLNALGYGAGPMAGSFILGAGRGMPALFLASALVLLPFALLMRAAPDAAVAPVRAADYVRDLRNPRARFLYLTIFVFALHFGVENVCYALFLKYNCGIPEARIGVVFLCVGLAIVPSSLITGLVSDRAQRSDGLLALGFALSGAFNAALFFVHSFWPVIALRVLHAVGDGIFLLYLDVAVARLFPAKRVGAPVGMRDMMRMGGMMCGSLLAGVIPGFSMPFLAVGLAGVAFAPLVYKYFRSM